MLLLIAGITISTLMGDHGILTQANNAKITTIEAKVNEEIELAVQSANMAIMSKTAENNSWSAVKDGIKPETAIEKTATSSITDETTNGVVLVALAGDLNKEGYSITVSEEEAGTRIITVEYAGQDYRNAKNDEKAKITKDIEVSQQGIALTNCRHIWNAGEVTKEATCTAKGEKQFVCTKCGESKTEEIAKVPHTYNSSEVCTVCGAEKIKIGAKIDYKEYISLNGTAFETMPTYTTQNLRSSDNKTYTVKEPAEEETGIEWIILGEENGQIKITTKDYVKPTSGTTLTLYGQAGYLNFVEELNKISAIYGKGKYADTSKYQGGTSGGRSFIMEDLGYSSLTRTAGYTYARHDNGKIYRYAANATVDGNSTTGGSYSKFEYMDLDASESTTEGQHSWKELTADNPSVTIYSYTYSGSNTLYSNYPETAKATSGGYWLASRYVTCSDSHVYFYARCVGSIGSLSSGYLYYSSGYSNGPSYGVRPVVYLKSDITLSYDAATNAYTIGETD